MILIFPTGSDAPLKYWPIATCVTLLMIIAVGIVQLLVPGFTDDWVLRFGRPNPLTWLTSAYLHGDFMHLFGNAVFLLMFGLIVEGKIGWWRFFLVYNLLAVLSGALICIFTLFASEGGCLGASCAITGLMVISFLWAPENEISFMGAAVVVFRPITFDFQLSIQQVCFCFIALDLVIASFSKFSISSAVLHLLGVPPGVAIGLALLKWRQVNCDGHDFVSLMTGKRGQSQLTIEEEAEEQKILAERAQQKRDQLQKGLDMVEFYIDQGHFEMALKRLKSLRTLKPEIVMTESQMVRIIDGLAKDDSNKQLYRTMLLKYLKHFDRLEAQVTLKLVTMILRDEQAGLQKLLSS